jgi:excisionase family DNA binding protein
MAAPTLLGSREVAALLGVSTSSVKRWADEGQLPCVKTAGNHRRFERAAVEAFRVRHVQGEGAGPSEWLRALLADAGTHALTGRLLASRDRLGSWAAVADALGPVLAELGDAWANGRVSVVEEHLAAERLARALERVGEWLPVRADAPRALLLTAEGDEHTLGLSLVELGLRELGWQTLWAGRRTPHEEIPDLLAADARIRLVVASASLGSNDARALARQAEQLARDCRRAGVTVVFGGGGAWPETLRHGARLRSVAELATAVGTAGELAA